MNTTGKALRPGWGRWEGGVHTSLGYDGNLRQLATHSHPAGPLLAIIVTAGLT